MSDDDGALHGLMVSPHLLASGFVTDLQNFAMKVSFLASSHYEQEWICNQRYANKITVLSTGCKCQLLVCQVIVLN